MAKEPKKSDQHEQEKQRKTESDKPKEPKPNPNVKPPKSDYVTYNEPDKRSITIILEE